MPNKIATIYLDLDPTINNNKQQMLLLSTPKKMILTLNHSTQEEYL